VGIAHNIGDALTYWIFDEQTKHVYAQSVVQPYRSNNRVKFDPQLDSKGSTHTAHSGRDNKPSPETIKEKLDHSMDVYDEQEEEPKGYKLRSMKNKTPELGIRKTPDQGPLCLPGIDKSPREGNRNPVVTLIPEDPYKGSSQLRFSHVPIHDDPNIPMYDKEKKEFSRLHLHDTRYHPPKVDVFEYTRRTRSQSKQGAVPGATKKGSEMGLRTPRARTSKRIVMNATRWVSTVNTTLLGVLGMALGSVFLPTLVTALPTFGMRHYSYKPCEHKSKASIY
jgi:hypothetical protein